MENVFDFRNKLIEEYSSFSRSFVTIKAKDIESLVEQEYASNRYWPEPLIQINPNYQRKGTIQELAAQGVVHPACGDIFKVGKPEGAPEPLYLYTHQIQALAKAQNNESYIVTTGTGSGKSLSFFIPVVDRILKEKTHDDKPRTRAIIIYPMNALANSQLEELEKFLFDYKDSEKPFTVERYTGQETTVERESIQMLIDIINHLTDALAVMLPCTCLHIYSSDAHNSDHRLIMFAVFIRGCGKGNSGVRVLKYIPKQAETYRRQEL